MYVTESLVVNLRAMSLIRQLHITGSNMSKNNLYQGWEDGRTWVRKGILSIGLMGIFSGPVKFMAIGVVIASGWAIFMCDVVGMLTEARFTGPVIVIGCCKLTDETLTVLVAMFI